MFYFINKIIKTAILILAVIGFIAIGGLTFVREHIDFSFFDNKDSKIEKAGKTADFSKIDKEFEIISAGNIPFTGEYVYTKHAASGQKFIFFTPKDQKALSKEDFSSQNTITEKIDNFVNNFNILGFKFENFKITGNGSFQALNQNIPYVKFESDIVNLPIRGTQGIIGASQIKKDKSTIIISFNTYGKYSQIITSVFLSEVKIDK